MGAFALSSAEAELYGMVEAVTMAKGLVILAWEIGFRNLSNVIHLGTDSSAAKSFVCGKGLGKIRCKHPNSSARSNCSRAGRLGPR